MPDPWFDTDWLNRVKITIDNTKVSGSGSHVDFPGLITESNLPASFFTKVKSDGSDIVITKTDGTTKQKREVVSINTGSSKLELHTKIPSLSTSVDTDIYLYYNNSAASETNDTDTWNSGFAAIYHMDDDPDTSNIQDSTSNNADGIKNTANEPIESDGEFGKAQTYDALVGVIKVSGLENAMNTITLTSFFKPADEGEGNVGRIISKLDGITANDDWDFTLSSFRRLHFQAIGWSTSKGQWNSPSSSYALDVWSYVSVTYDHNSVSNDPEFRVNGNVKSATELTTPAGSTNARTSNTTIGNLEDEGKTFDGLIAEIRVSNVIRTGDWIKTEANGMNSPATWYSVGAEEDAPSGETNATKDFTASLSVQEINANKDVTASLSVQETNTNKNLSASLSVQETNINKDITASLSVTETNNNVDFLASLSVLETNTNKDLLTSLSISETNANKDLFASLNVNDDPGTKNVSASLSVQETNTNKNVSASLSVTEINNNVDFLASLSVLETNTNKNVSASLSVQETNTNKNVSASLSVTETNTNKDLLASLNVTETNANKNFNASISVQETQGVTKDFAASLNVTETGGAKNLLASINVLETNVNKDITASLNVTETNTNKDFSASLESLENPNAKNFSASLSVVETHGANKDFLASLNVPETTSSKDHSAEITVKVNSGSKDFNANLSSAAGIINFTASLSVKETAGSKDLSASFTGEKKLSKDFNATISVIYAELDGGLETGDILVQDNEVVLTI